MIFFDKLLKQRFGDKKREELWEKYTYPRKETTDYSYLVDINQDKPIKDNSIEENNKEKKNEEKKDTIHSIHPQ